jgi:hypothetical protein
VVGVFHDIDQRQEGGKGIGSEDLEGYDGFVVFGRIEEFEDFLLIVLGARRANFFLQAGGSYLVQRMSQGIAFVPMAITAVVESSGGVASQ